MDDLRSIGVQVMAASVDSQEDTARLAGKLGISFPMGCGLDPLPTANALGGYYEPDDHYLQPASFILDPELKVATACYSSGPVGRIEGPDALWLVRYFKGLVKP